MRYTFVSGVKSLGGGKLPTAWTSTWTGDPPEGKVSRSRTMTCTWLSAVATLPVSPARRVWWALCGGLFPAASCGGGASQL